MSKLENAIISLQQMQVVRSDVSVGRTLNPVCGIVVTLAYLIAMLSVPVDRVGMLIWFALYPIVASPWLGMTFVTVFKRSLIALPFIVFVGIFNPLFDADAALTIGHITVSRGWVTFTSILLRGLMSVQALVILIASCGFEGVCRGMRRMGVSAFIVTQLLMVYRYMTVLLIELLTMKRARASRSYGNPRLTLKMWGQMIGQLFIRTVGRAERINNAMLARGFNGTMPVYPAAKSGLSAADAVFATVCLALFAVLRFTDVSEILGFNRLF